MNTEYESCSFKEISTPSHSDDSRQSGTEQASHTVTDVNVKLLSQLHNPQLNKLLSTLASNVPLCRAEYVKENLMTRLVSTARTPTDRTEVEHSGSKGSPESGTGLSGGTRKTSRKQDLICTTTIPEHDPASSSVPSEPSPRLSSCLASLLSPSNFNSPKRQRVFTFDPHDIDASCRVNESPRDAVVGASVTPRTPTAGGLEELDADMYAELMEAAREAGFFAETPRNVRRDGGSQVPLTPGIRHVAESSEQTTCETSQPIYVNACIPTSPGSAPPPVVPTIRDLDSVLKRNRISSTSIRPPFSLSAPPPPVPPSAPAPPSAPMNEDEWNATPEAPSSAAIVHDCCGVLDCGGDVTRTVQPLPSIPAALRSRPLMTCPSSPVHFAHVNSASAQQRKDIDQLPVSEEVGSDTASNDGNVVKATDEAEKSLVVLCKVFVHHYKSKFPLDGNNTVSSAEQGESGPCTPSEEDRTINVPIECKKFAVSIRRLQNLLRLLECVGVVARITPRRFTWMGFEHIASQFGDLQDDAISIFPQRAANMGFSNVPSATSQTSNSYETNKVAPSDSTEDVIADSYSTRTSSYSGTLFRNNSPALVPVSEYSTGYLQIAAAPRPPPPVLLPRSTMPDEKYPLEQVCRNFIQLFLLGENRLRVQAAKDILRSSRVDNESIGPDRLRRTSSTSSSNEDAKNKESSLSRRLHDAASVLCALGILERVVEKTTQGRRTVFYSWNYTDPIKIREVYIASPAYAEKRQRVISAQQKPMNRLLLSTTCIKKRKHEEQI
mmetsp:Transcript_21598/g.31422  ORF Transcript_21598/g.31422 Transcript_21598/m.31422 type:complete len:779 (-) Transcript_21598:97-2433(-)|eukprot:CAMPEP_0185038370 /NCGR_PEP_ID=MMETSP1103-20130426/33924_1 /TAXON_ID=36769 /ORGANISM="Paraphysomonas bandaiensis, Strain Caron Lab Isolate" /LENGTH=778 /DNA_ID=CAMNT_0027576765 /DNA_START=118 /DNA_END=2457 /DNA_ORIENTATION=+